jgi:hypothetical protein
MLLYLFEGLIIPCLCWFCYIDLTQMNFLTADMNYISHTIWRYIQNPPTYQISYAYTNSVSTKYYDSRISFSLILHHMNHMKKQGRVLQLNLVNWNLCNWETWVIDCPSFVPWFFCVLTSTTDNLHNWKKKKMTTSIIDGQRGRSLCNWL